VETFSVSYRSEPAELSAVAAGLTKFERMRVIPGLVIVALCTGVVYAVRDGADFSNEAIVVCIVFFAVMAVLSMRWLTTAARVGKAARSYEGPTSVQVSADGLQLSRGGAVVTKTTWNDVAVCTNTTGCWIFVPKKSKEIIFLPQTGMEAAQRQQVGAILAGWPKRRYRSTTW